MVRLNCKIVHEGGIKYEICPKVVLSWACPQDDPDDIVHHISVSDHAETKTEKSKDSLSWVICCDIAIADSADCVHSPVERIEIANSPAVVYDGGVGSGRVEPAHCIVSSLRELFYWQTGRWVSE